jgi:hypothetical protein
MGSEGVQHCKKNQVEEHKKPVCYTERKLRKIKFGMVVSSDE